MKVKHLPKYTELLRLLWKYGHSNVFQKAQFQAELGEEDAGKTNGHEPSPDDFAKDFEKLGATFIKLGQVLSTRPDLLPDPYLDALSRLQDDLEPFPFSEVEVIVQEELGVRISKAFQVFEQEPLASASLGQVHRAVLRDGKEVAVKVQRPGIRQRILEDLEALEEAAVFLENTSKTVRRIELSGLVQQFRKVLLSELDHRLEARNLQTLAKNLEDFDLIVVPLPVESYSSGKVLTMDFIKGKKVTKISPLHRMEIDGEALADQFFKAYLKQLVNDGFMHADPHPGNVHLTDDNRLALIDLGMVVRLNQEIQEKYLQ
ncbi:MAG: AarF/UbiB family protein, partial [Bacteroidota bacterium]